MLDEAIFSIIINIILCKKRFTMKCGGILMKDLEIILESKSTYHIFFPLYFIRLLVTIFCQKLVMAGTMNRDWLTGWHC